MSLVRPHGAARRLEVLLAPPSERDDEIARAASLRRLPMSSRETSDLLMLGIGAFTPLRGFMGAADWRRVCDEMCLADGTFWPIPITLPATEELASAIGPGEEVALVDGESRELMGTLTVEEKYRIDRLHECREADRTVD